MYSLFVAIGNAARSISEAPASAFAEEGDCRISVVSRSEIPVFAQLSVPEESGPSLLGISTNKDAYLLIDGYIVRGNDDNLRNEESLSRLIGEIREHGLSTTLNTISSGSFNLVYIDIKDRSVQIANDEVGSIPLYYARVKGGVVACNSPTNLARMSVVEKALDLNTCASILKCGYAIGDRHFLRTTKLLPSGSLLSWRNDRATVHKVGLRLNDRVPSRRAVKTEEVAETVRAALKRAAKTDDNIAHLQSAGLDSRLILAAWPDGQNLSCYAYGHPDSTEQRIAKQVAKVGGSRFTYFRPDGDTVADSVDKIFELSGMIAYADRLLISKKIRDDGYGSVLDGFQGGALLGGAYYYNDRYFSTVRRLARFATIYNDQRISAVGYPAIAWTLNKHICGRRTIREKFPYLSDGFATELENRDKLFVRHIEEECKRLSPINDSVGTLFRNFLMENRGLHAIAHQGVMCRAHVRAIFPYTNDRHLYDLCLTLDPAAVAYRRMYYRMYATHFPAYADIVYGDSMVAARRSPLIHGAYKLLARIEQRLTRTSTHLFRVTIKPNNWAAWFRESSLLRQKLLSDLEDSSLIDSKRLKTFFRSLEDGSRGGTGDLFHLASVVRWSKIG